MWRVTNERLSRSRGRRVYHTYQGATPSPSVYRRDQRHSGVPSFIAYIRVTVVDLAHIISGLVRVTEGSNLFLLSPGSLPLCGNNASLIRNRASPDTYLCYLQSERPTKMVHMLSWERASAEHPAQANHDVFNERTD